MLEINYDTITTVDIDKYVEQVRIGNPMYLKFIETLGIEPYEYNLESRLYYIKTHIKEQALDYQRVKALNIMTEYYNNIQTPKKPVKKPIKKLNLESRSLKCIRKNLDKIDYESEEIYKELGLETLVHLF